MRALFSQLFLIFALVISAFFSSVVLADETVIVSEKTIDPITGEYHLFLKKPPTKGQSFMQWWESVKMPLLTKHELLDPPSHIGFFYLINFYDVDEPDELYASATVKWHYIETLAFDDEVLYFRNDKGEYMDDRLLESYYYLGMMLEQGLGLKKPAQAYADLAFQYVCREANYKDSCDRIKDRSFLIPYYGFHKKTDRYFDAVVIGNVPRDPRLIERWWLENESYFLEEYGVPTYADDGSYMIEVRQATKSASGRSYDYDHPARWGAYRQICYDNVEFIGSCLDKEKSLVMTIIKHSNGRVEFKPSKHYNFDRPSELK